MTKTRKVPLPPPPVSYKTTLPSPLTCCSRWRPGCSPSRGWRSRPSSRCRGPEGRRRSRGLPCWGRRAPARRGPGACCWLPGRRPSGSLWEFGREERERKWLIGLLRWVGIGCAFRWWSKKMNEFVRFVKDFNMHYYRIYCIIYTLKLQLIVNRNTTQLKTLPQPNPKHLNAPTRISHKSPTRPATISNSPHLRFSLMTEMECSWPSLNFSADMILSIPVPPLSWMSRWPSTSDTE